MLPAWAEHDPEAAWQWFQKAARSQLNFDARGTHHSALKEMFAVMGRNHFSRGLNRILELQGTEFFNATLGLNAGVQTMDERSRLIAQVDSVADPRTRDDSRRAVFSTWAADRPSEAKAYVEAMSDSAVRSVTARHVGLGLFSSAAPEDAADWWLRQTIPADLSTTLSQITRRWVEIDLVAAAEWLRARGNGPETDKAKDTFAIQAAQRAPATAMEWAGAISNGSDRIAALRTLYQGWRGRSAAEAEAWLMTSNLPPDQRQEVQAP